MKIDEALEEFDFFNEGDYITRGMFIAKDVVLQELENTRADLYEANNRINDLLDIVKQKDKIIDLMANEILEQDILNQEDIEHYDNKHEVIKYFEERCNK